jgi:adenylate cyclase
VSVEIERKFRLHREPEWLGDCRPTRIEQGYLEIGSEQFEALWSLTEGRRVEKVRYLVPTESGEVEVDVFGGELAGIITAEMEFDSEAASDAFEPPDSLGIEVTGDERHANETLATRGLPRGR